MQRSPLLDYIRHMLALMVIVSHSWAVTHGDNTTEPLIQLTHKHLSLGTLAVLGFFFLSGHLITQSWRRTRGAGIFVLRRTARLAPAWIAALAFATLLGWLGGGFLTNPIPSDGNFPLWTLWFEVFCYVFVLLTRGRSWLIAVLALVLIARGFPGLAPWMFLCFAAGSLMHCVPACSEAPSEPDEGRVKGRVSLPPLPGDYSYGLYVYTFPIQQLLVFTLGTQMHPLILAGLAFALSLPLCALSWHYLEAPILEAVRTGSTAGSRSRRRTSLAAHLHRTPPDRRA